MRIANRIVNAVETPQERGFAEPEGPISAVILLASCPTRCRTALGRAIEETDVGGAQLRPASALAFLPVVVAQKRIRVQCS